jgi:GxxExxY protein
MNSFSGTAVHIIFVRSGKRIGGFQMYMHYPKSSNVQTRSKRNKMKCSMCKQEGHNKKKCPQKDIPVPTPEEVPECVDDVPVAEEPDTPDVATVRKLASEVLDALGPGHTESVYHNAMKIGIQDENLKYETERDILIKFRGRYVGTVRADIIIENRLVVELKSSTGTDTAVSDALEQCRIYMKETSIPSGMVVVFPKRVGGKLIVSKAT